MPVLRTSEQVVTRTRVEALPQYFDIVLIDDIPGFAARRLYPDDSDLSLVRNRQGEQLAACIIQFMVERPTSPQGVSKVILRAWFSPRWKTRHLFAAAHELPPTDPLAPTPNSLQRLRQARLPVEVEIEDMYLYDVAADEFTDAEGQRTNPEAMLEYVYSAHVRTLRAGFVWSWNAGTVVRRLARVAVWRGQDLFQGLLFRLYDIQPTTLPERRSPFHEFSREEFLRPKDVAGNFFGFESSRRSLFTNLVVLAVTSALIYQYAPRDGFVGAIYRNNALTTAALVLGFFLADTLGPWFFITAIMILSRLRPFVGFFFRKVKTGGH
jgi:hypothetical protein